MGAAAAASLSFMIMGMVRAWSSPGMPSLLDSKAVPLTESDVSWISKLGHLQLLKVLKMVCVCGNNRLRISHQQAASHRWRLCSAVCWLDLVWLFWVGDGHWCWFPSRTAWDSCWLASPLTVPCFTLGASWMDAWLASAPHRRKFSWVSISCLCSYDRSINWNSLLGFILRCNRLANAHRRECAELSELSLQSFSRWVFWSLM